MQLITTNSEDEDRGNVLMVSKGTYSIQNSWVLNFACCFHMVLE